MARRDDREYREYLSEEQRSQRGCIARRMQPGFHHGLLEVISQMRFNQGFCFVVSRFRGFVPVRVCETRSTVIAGGSDAVTG
jgi:hypothetical protein